MTWLIAILSFGVSCVEAYNENIDFYTVTRCIRGEARQFS